MNLSDVLSNVSDPSEKEFVLSNGSPYPAVAPTLATPPTFSVSNTPTPRVNSIFQLSQYEIFFLLFFFFFFFFPPPFFFFFPSFKYSLSRAFPRNACSFFFSN